MTEHKDDIVRVLRVIEYVGRRTQVEPAVARSIHGTKVISPSGSRQALVINAATIGTYPEILEQGEKPNND